LSRELRGYHAVDGAIATTSYQYDRLGRQLEKLVGETKSTFVYGAFEQATTEVDGRAYEGTVSPTQVQVTKVYDGLGQIESLTTPVAAGYSVKYDAFGNLTQKTESTRASTTDATQYYFYDERKLLTFAVDGEGFVTQNIYDHLGQLTEKVTYITALANASTQSYSNLLSWAAGQRVQGATPDELTGLSHRLTMQYDKLGFLLRSDQYYYEIDFNSGAVALDVNGKRIVKTAYEWHKKQS
jgi:YD repeat-containing protein